MVTTAGMHHAMGFSHGVILPKVCCVWYCLPSGLSWDVAQTTYQMIATAVCPECKESIWLLGATTYIPGAAPEIFEGQDPVTFSCCGKTQSVPAASIRFKLSSVTQFRASA
jgi:hypothetical protein